MAIKPEHTEIINGVKIEYLSYSDRKITVSNENKQYSIKDIMDAYGKKVAPYAVKQGYARVQIGSHGDFYHFGITKGTVIPLSIMFIARFLKR